MPDINESVPASPSAKPENIRPEDLNKVQEQVETSLSQGERREASPQEVVKESLKSVYPASTPPPHTPAPPAPAPAAPNPNLPDYLNSSSPETRAAVERLVNIALKDGISKAVDEAKSSHPFILDALHDALVDKIYPQLVERGVFKK